MSAKPTHRLGRLQLQIMKVLWHRREATVAQVLEAVRAEAELAYTTIATMLRKMEDKGLVEHRVFNRSYIYRASVTEEAVTKSMANDLIDRLFEGSLSDMVSHLLTNREITDDELSSLEEMIQSKRSEK